MWGIRKLKHFLCKKCKSQDLCLDCCYDDNNNLIPPIDLSCRNCLRHEKIEKIPQDLIK